MDLDLDRMLTLTRRGQWSTADIDWDRPLQGADHLSQKARRALGLELLFTAGLERQAAKVFALCRHYIEDPTAKLIYALFEEDELRHADAEVLLANRLGVTERNLPAGVKWMFRQLEKNHRKPDLGLHEISSATILLFELALDSLLIPALKEQIDDPIQTEVFKRIDQDEARHLAMDYWLLDKKGEAQRGQTLQQILEAAQGRATWADKARGRVGLYRTFAAFMVGFGALTVRVRKYHDPQRERERLESYVARVKKIPNRAPLSMYAPAFAMGMRGQKTLVKLISSVVGFGPPAELTEEPA